MTKTVLYKIEEGTEVIKDEVKRSVCMHITNFKPLLDRFENDNKNFGTSQDEAFKSICENTMTACQNKQTKVNEIIEHLLERLHEPDDVTLKTETEGKRDTGAQRLENIKKNLTDLIIKFNKDKAEKEKSVIEKQESQVVKGSSSVVTAEVNSKL